MPRRLHPLNPERRNSLAGRSYKFAADVLAFLPMPVLRRLARWFPGHNPPVAGFWEYAHYAGWARREYPRRERASRTESER